MKTINISRICCFTLLLITACEDILIKDISSDVIELQGPADGTVVASQTLTFWWNDLDGVLNYELLVASPDRSSPLTVSLDTLVTKTRFNFDLPKGNYEWCVRGANTEYKTEYTCRTITIN